MLFWRALSTGVYSRTNGSKQSMYDRQHSEDSLFPLILFFFLIVLSRRQRQWERQWQWPPYELACCFKGLGARAPDVEGRRSQEQRRAGRGGVLGNLTGADAFDGAQGPRSCKSSSSKRRRGQRVACGAILRAGRVRLPVEERSR